MHGFTRLALRLGLGLLVSLDAPLAGGQQGMDRGGWHHDAGDVGATKYSSLDQIDADNIGTLQIAWQRPAVDQSILDRVHELSYGAGLGVLGYLVDVGGRDIGQPVGQGALLLGLVGKLHHPAPTAVSPFIHIRWGLGPPSHTWVPHPMSLV